MSRLLLSRARNNELADALGVVNAQSEGARTDGDVTGNIGKLHDARTKAVSQGRPLWLPDPEDAYGIDEPFNLFGSGLRAFGRSRETTIIRPAPNTPGLIIGGRHQYVSDLRVEYATQQPSTNTMATAILLKKPYWSTAKRLWARHGARGVEIAQEDVVLEEVTTGNTAFSSTFEDIRVHGFSIDGVNLNSYGGGGTGNIWNNTYISNNPDGTKLTPTGNALIVNEYDEMVFNQLNIEWSAATNDVIFFETVGAMIINGLHIEQVDLSAANFAYIALSDDVRLLLNGTSLVWNTLAGVSTRYFIRAFGDIDVDVRGLRHHNNTKGGLFTFLNANGATAGQASVRASGIMPGLFDSAVANEKAAPQQVLRQFNDDRYLWFENGKVRTYGTAAPTAGTWAVGDRVTHSNPAASGVHGWVCTAAGSPGTWKALGTVAA